MATSAPKTSTTTSSKSNPKAPPKGAPDEETEAADPPVRRGSWLKIGLALLLLLAIAGGGAWYFLHDSGSEADGKPGAVKKASKAEKVAAAKAAAAIPPVFATLEPFIVNLQHEDAAPQYLQVGLVVKVSDDAVTDAIKLHTPEIRNRVLLLLSGKRASEISTPEGKQALSTELMHEIGEPLAGSVPKKAISAVLFTSFVIQ